MLKEHPEYYYPGSTHLQPCDKSICRAWVQNYMDIYIHCEPKNVALLVFWYLKKPHILYIYRSYHKIKTEVPLFWTTL